MIKQPLVSKHSLNKQAKYHKYLENASYDSTESNLHLYLDDYLIKISISYFLLVYDGSWVKNTSKSAII